jgi:hypothetical protein
MPLDKTSEYSLNLEASEPERATALRRQEGRTDVQSQTTEEIVEVRGKKSRGGSASTRKMLKMKVDPEMCMKTKDDTTICPTQKTTFLPGCTPFYTENTYFSETVGVFVLIRAPENAKFASKM